MAKLSAASMEHWRELGDGAMATLFNGSIVDGDGWRPGFEQYHLTLTTMMIQRRREADDDPSRCIPSFAGSDGARGGDQSGAVIW
ncbi:unnamed protein product [Linum trigynum]|uniref:Uncharacterized protein n=1 Tax=Linum trigynum TaxID=586398 RepID=A0AAV2CIR7_9ROSI